jgi:hypothetical protein
LTTVTLALICEKKAALVTGTSAAAIVLIRVARLLQEKSCRGATEKTVYF